MKDLITYTILAIIGYFVGSKMREHRWVTKWTGRIQTAAIAILLFTMGLRMGSNDEVTDHLSSIGLISVAMTLAIIESFCRINQKVYRHGSLGRHAE